MNDRKLIARALAGKAVRIPKDKLLLVADGWQKKANSATNQTDRDGFTANALYFRNMYNIINDGGEFVQTGW